MNPPSPLPFPHGVRRIGHPGRCPRLSWRAPVLRNTISHVSGCGTPPMTTPGHCNAADPWPKLLAGLDIWLRVGRPRRLEERFRLGEEGHWATESGLAPSGDQVKNCPHLLQGTRVNPSESRAQDTPVHRRELKHERYGRTAEAVIGFRLDQERADEAQRVQLCGQRHDQDRRETRARGTCLRHDRGPATGLGSPGAARELDPLNVADIHSSASE